MKYFLILFFFLIPANAFASDDILDIINKKHNIDVHFEDLGKDKEGGYCTSISDFAYSYQLSKKSGFEIGRHVFNNDVSFNSKGSNYATRAGDEEVDGLPRIRLENKYLQYKYSIYLTDRTRFSVGPMAYFRRAILYNESERLVNNRSDFLSGVGFSFQNEDFLPFDLFFQSELKIARGNGDNRIIDSENFILRKITESVYGGLGLHLQNHKIKNNFINGRLYSYSIVGTVGVAF